MATKARRVLIVEDDPDTADLLAQQLEGEGVDVEMARNGQEAILKTAAEPPDIIIMDVMMPRLDGFETSRFLKAKFRDTFVPIVVLTAKDDPQSRAKGAKFGCEDYMTKPYSRKNLVATMDELLRLGQLERDVLAPIPEPEPDAEGNVAPAAVARAEKARAQRVAATASLVEVRCQVAERQLAGPSAEMARVHLKRILELDPSNTKANQLCAQLGNEL